MSIYFELAHKKQTKLNDCWYACIQMLRSAQAGKKTKTIGDAALRLRNVPILGRTLRAEPGIYSVFYQILQDNGLARVPGTPEFQSFLNMTAATGDLEAKALNTFGPIMIGGMYGRLFGRKKVGHYIVLSGIDTESRLFKVNDPDRAHADWRTYHQILKDYWGNVYPPDDRCNAIAARPA